MQGMGLLSTLVWLPIVGGLVVLALGDARIGAARWVALVTAVAAFALSVPLYTGFDASTPAYQFVE
ncbi:MAG: NADH-quinone oxidoreductase subunit M, partial [Gammaproteobacteria bacterium]|nr:NADH-quinone oxidoreductase subunit M [Gammaproteobacteria bacterium]